MSEDLVGKRLGNYRIDKVIGHGGMAVLYKATDVRLGRKVALKVMGEHLTGDPEFRERFVDEARNTSAIDHANVVPLYDFGETDGLLYIAMRFVDGSDLDGRIKDGPLAPARALNLIGQVAAALDLLHGRGLVHLDIKPANVLVTSRESSSGTGEHVYLADFGLTRRGATGHRTRTGDFLGSPTYAAPEHLRGESVDGRTDQYSLACVLYACLTGRPPFPGGVTEVIRGHLGGEPPPVSALAPLPAGIDEVLRRGMAKDPQRRFADCAELTAAAHNALAPMLGGPQGGPPSGGFAALGRPGSGGPPPGAGTPPPGMPSLGPSGPYPAPGAAPGTSAGGPPPPSGAPMSAGLPPGVPPQRPGQGPGADPVRLRPPMPAQPSAFRPTSGGWATWLVPILVAVAAVVVVVVLLLLFARTGSASTWATPLSGLARPEWLALRPGEC